ncbi:Hypothetical protein R9X50_00339300 [Acrodontium crateriforme]|uniref:Protein kinase domain-containing protein n=1 Tax=Acrodontium crateriforme TaxID=150365 RepID=A0AAQ3M5N0_9PEZI|nr:Hypothetical protein R9X50_00339300 [Acrodontium crateriforme]
MKHLCISTIDDHDGLVVAVAHVAIELSSSEYPGPAYLSQFHHDSEQPFDCTDNKHRIAPRQTCIDRPANTRQKIKTTDFKKALKKIRSRLEYTMAAVAHRPHIRRNSPLSALQHGNGFSADAPMMKRIDVSDSDSDDEPPPAIKFSKVTQALLADAPVPSSPPKNENRANDGLSFNRSFSAKPALDTPSRAPGIKIVRKGSPSAQAEAKGNTPPRVVRLATNAPGSAVRSVSISGPYPPRTKREPTPETFARSELVTPAPRSFGRARAGSDTSQDGYPPLSNRPASRPGSRGPIDHQNAANEAELNRSATRYRSAEAGTRYAPSTIARSRHASAEAAPPSQRMKRAPAVTGSFLKSGPVRRGFRRRDSEENISPQHEIPNGSTSQPSASDYTPQTRGVSGERSRQDSGNVSTRATSVEAQELRRSENGNNSYFSRSQNNDSAIRSRTASRERPGSRQPSVDRFQARRQPSISDSEQGRPGSQQKRRPSIDQGKAMLAIQPHRVPSLRAQPRYAAPKVQTDASEEQENMPPPTFRRNKDQEFKYLGKPASTLSDDEKPKRRLVDETPVPVHAQQEQRKALGAISGNTAHRPAPAPPPKMSVLETATTTAGASVTKSKKKRSHMVVNGKIFTQMGKIGKGGSSDVYCVMAENYKTFALKRVKLEDCDESAVRGFKGEIDLLKSLADVERVVRLFDWELNEEKQELSVLMEKGDTDLNRIMTLRLNGGDAKFDGTFTRYYWREMLECVQAVHDHDIVHSDLKPANFLLAQGRLKLIDFGIANAIDTDNTCNVHRDSHVGTPNYMSPESITDTNAPGPGQQSSDGPRKKDMRIGKASDVWSLGCILYQMTYGRPPFAHIANQISRIMAITNPHHVISFPETGVGGVAVPPALRGTLRKCLARDPNQRPTIPQLLSDDHPFMNPDAPAAGVLVTEDLLGQIINKVVDRCRDPKRGLPTPEEVGQYPRSFIAKIKEMQAGG